MALYLNKFEFSLPKKALCHVWLKLAQWIWRRRFFNFVNVFSLFRNYLPLAKGRALHLNKLDSPSPKDTLCQVWLKLAQRIWRRRFLNFVNVSSLFHYSLPLENSWALHLNKQESLSPKNALCQVWLKLAQWFSRRRFFNFVNVFSLFRNYLPLEKGGALHLNKQESPSPKDALCQVWLKLDQWFWRRRWKCEKFTDGRTDGRTDRRTDDGRKVIRKAHLSFQLRWAKNTRHVYLLGKNINKPLVHFYYALQTMLCSKFGCNWPNGCGEEDF